jgi:hypothetical protein
VPAPEIETLVLKAIREHLQAIDTAEHEIAASDHDLIEGHVERIVIKSNVIELRLLDNKDEPTTPGDRDHDQDRSDPQPLNLALPWAAQTFSAVKGVLLGPLHRQLQWLAGKFPQLREQGICGAVSGIFRWEQGNLQRDCRACVMPRIRYDSKRRSCKDAERN